MSQSQTFKDVVEKQLAEKTTEMKQLHIQLPYFFRMKRYNTETSKAFKPLPQKATPKEWHETILWLQIALKETRADSSEMMGACRELLQFTFESFKLLSDAYDIQGRILMKVCEQLNVDFDSMIADFIMAKNDKGVAFIVNTPTTPANASGEKAEEANGSSEEDNISSMPF